MTKPYNEFHDVEPPVPVRVPVDKRDYIHTSLDPDEPAELVQIFITTANTGDTSDIAYAVRMMGTSRWYDMPAVEFI